MIKRVKQFAVVCLAICSFSACDSYSDEFKGDAQTIHLRCHKQYTHFVKSDLGFKAVLIRLEETREHVDFEEYELTLFDIIKERIVDLQSSNHRIVEGESKQLDAKTKKFFEDCSNPDYQMMYGEFNDKALEYDGAYRRLGDSLMNMNTRFSQSIMQIDSLCRLHGQTFRLI